MHWTPRWIGMTGRVLAMANDQGYICLHRSLMKHWLFQDAEYTYAWIDLLMSAQWQDESKKRLIGGKLVETKRGEYAASLRFLSRRWSFGVGKVRQLMVLLEDDTMIARRTTQGVTVISILNYSKYNTGFDTASAQRRHSGNTNRRRENK
jgi:hypothetical protein